MQVKCSICEKLFNKKFNLKTKHHFCSKECWRKYLRKNLTLPFPKKGQNFNTGRTWFKKGKTTSEKQKEIAKRNWIGSNNPRWSPIGTKRKSHDYIIIKIAENLWMPEHIVVAERKIGRKLYRDECVHHINEIKDDNHPSNLKVMLKKDHKSYHAKNKHYAKNFKN